MRFRILSACALACACVVGAAGAAAAAQDSKGTQAEVKVSGGERDAAAKIEKAKGTEARLQAASEFVKKYPNSTLRPRIAKSLADEVAATTDPQMKISLGQVYLDIFNRPEETQYVNTTLLNTYINSGKTDEAMKAGAAWLQQHPDDIPTMQNLTILAAAAAIRGDNTYIAQGRQYGAKAIEMLEADRMPAGADATRWPDFKKSALVSLYRETGILAYKSSDSAAALSLLEKAAALKSPDPGVYLLLSDLSSDEYQSLAKQYQVASAAEKPAALQKAQAALDKVIENYAQAIAVTDGNPTYQQVNAAMRQNLTENYKYRHNGSTEGMQQLIDKYKKQ
jgi:hypothetical protein